MPRVAFHTLGCKVNQYESEKISRDFTKKGFDVVDFSDDADVYIINTCTVTGVADSKSRQVARAAAQKHPGAKVVLTGCYAETSPEEASAIPGVVMVIGNKEKGDLAKKVVDLLGFSCSEPSNLHDFTKTRTRALLKVQDGCDQFCAYCAVPLARSEMWSKPYDEVISEARELVSVGYKEIVLTGIRLGRYLYGEVGLDGLVSGLSEIDGLERIRLSSIELTDIPSGFMRLMAENKKICRHLHIPLQSGDDDVLCRMNRPYTTSDFKEYAERARSVVPELAITTDIMVGFPGETVEQFNNTLRFAEEISFSRAHVFRYSPRPGTVAADMSGMVSPQEKQHRSEMLMNVTSKSAQAFIEEMAGKTVQVLVESKENSAGKRSGLTDNYVRVVFDAAPEMVGKIVDVRIEAAEKGSALGVLCI